jgi:D-psicose/D-tagatose/L-ribulose 3-epimerase
VRRSGVTSSSLCGAGAGRWPAAAWAVLIGVGAGAAGCAHAPELPPPPPPKVSIGFCTGVAGLEEAKAAGFDYVELGVSAIARLPPLELEAALIRHRAIGLPTPVANGFLPAEVRVAGPEVDPDKQLAYVRVAFDRVVRFGVKLIVFGSPAARNVPAGFPRQEAMKQLVAFGKLIAPEAQRRGLVIGLEALRRQESNIVNTTAEALQVVRAVGHPSFQLTVDFYHLAIEKEDPAILLQAREHVRHLHFANPDGRVFPLDASEYDYYAFFENLRRIGYQGGLSVEARPKNGIARDGPISVGFLRAKIVGP